MSHYNFRNVKMNTFTVGAWPAGKHAQIVVKLSGWCYDLHGKNAMNMACNRKKPTQYWIYQGNTIRNAKGNQCLRVNQPKAGQKLHVGPCNGNHKWKIEKGAHGHRIVSYQKI